MHPLFPYPYELECRIRPAVEHVVSFQDLLFVIAHGAASARAAASNLLFFYWPMLNPTGVDRRSIHFKFAGKNRPFSLQQWSSLFLIYLARKAITCQTERCLEKRNIASKVCVNILLSIHGHDTPPPLYMCTDCFKNSSKEMQAYCRNIVCPISEIDLRCQNKVNSFGTREWFTRSAHGSMGPSLSLAMYFGEEEHARHLLFH